MLVHLDSYCGTVADLSSDAAALRIVATRLADHGLGTEVLEYRDAIHLKAAPACEPQCASLPGDRHDDECLVPWCLTRAQRLLATVDGPRAEVSDPADQDRTADRDRPILRWPCDRRGPDPTHQDPARGDQGPAAVQRARCRCHRRHPRPVPTCGLPDACVHGQAGAGQLPALADRRGTVARLRHGGGGPVIDPTCYGPPDPVPIEGPDGPVALDREDQWSGEPVAPEPGPTARRLVLTQASSIPPRPVRWLWTGRIPTGLITLVPGREGIGKSLFMSWLTACITTGTLPGASQGTPRPVIYAATEDSWAHTIVPRLHAAGADLDRVYRVQVTEGTSTHQLTLPHDCADLADQINDLDVALLAADPLLSLIAAEINTHHDRDLRTALEPLAQLADTTSCAVVGLAHFNKSTTTTDVLNLITGSRAFSSLTRVVLAIARDPGADDDSCVLSLEKNNVGRKDLPSLRYVIDSVDITTPEGPAEVGKLRFIGETDRTVSDILNAGNQPKTHGDNDRVGQWLHDQLTALGGQAPTAQLLELAAENGIAERTLRRARERIGVIATRSGFGTGSVWQLAEDRAPSASTQPGHVPANSGQDTNAGRNGRNGRNDTATDHTPSLHVVKNPAGDAS
ncbi:MAG: AAA family ATPase [Streptosporangiales bacterium]|nr:AAA family ATPase [Streptosporangiales bacterium]